MNPGGDPALSVQAVVYPVVDEILPALAPLLDSDHQEIQHEFRATLLRRPERPRSQRTEHGSVRQYSRSRTLKSLARHMSSASDRTLRVQTGRRDAEQRLKVFAMPWFGSRSALSSPGDQAGSR